MIHSVKLTVALVFKQMDIVNSGQIKSIDIPDGWFEGASTPGGVGFRSLRVFYRADKEEVKICFSSRGRPMSEQGSASFRGVLKKEPGAIFLNSGRDQSDAEIAVVKSLRECLGTAADNQIVNKENGWRGPCFQMNKAEVLLVNGKKVLAVQGLYRDPEKDCILNEFSGVFIDADPKAQLSWLEEVYFQAPDAQQYASFLPDFTDMLRSISWKDITR